MKAQRHSLKEARAGDEKGLPAEKSAERIPRGRLWLFWIVATVGIPLFVLVTFELVLRCAGYGYPTSYFLKSEVAGKHYFVPNERFGYRFFPPVLARTPLPLRVVADKPPNTYRIFVFGESAAMGDPDPSFGMWRYLQTLLRERFPGTDFEVVCVAMTAINSHVILPIARECAHREGDLWIIYMGNNEMVGPFGAGTVFGARTPGAGLVRANLAVKATKTGQLLDSLVERWGNRSSTPRVWSGLNMFKDHQLRSEDPGRLRADENFKENLEDILAAGCNARVPIILSTVGSNLRDCSPFSSLHKTGLSESAKADWEGLYQRGITQESTGNYSGALEYYAQAALIDGEYADLHFRAGRCQLALTNLAAASHEFELARDEDTLAFRADTRINQIIKTAALSHTNRGVHLLDAETVLGQNSPAKISDNELFYEHVHLNFAGNYLLGRAFAEQTSKLLPKSILTKDKGEWASAELCDRRLAVSPWDRSRVWQQNYSRVSEPPFTEQLNDVPRAQFYIAKLKELNSQMTGETYAQSRAMYEEALALTPDDYLLRKNFAQFLDQTGDLPAAIKEMQCAGKLLPPMPETYHTIGELLVRAGKTRDAADSFSRALAIRGDYVPTLNDLGLIRANQRKTTEAAEYFRGAIKLNSGYVEAYLNWGFMEQCEGKMDQAVAHYREASQLQPTGPAAHFYQAVTLAAAHDREKSIGYFRNAVWMNPKFWQARYLLGGELAAGGKIEEAQAQFSEAVHIRPDFARAHLNDGVALAKLGKLQEALKEFQIAVELNPTDTVARQNLDAVQMNIRALGANRP